MLGFDARMHLKTLHVAFVAAVVATASMKPTSVDAEDYVPASSGKRFTPIRGPELSFIGGFTVGVPIFLDKDSDVVRPGGDMNGWLGLDMEWVALALGLGASWNPINLNAVEGVEAFGQSPLARLYVSPELRFQVPKAKGVLPYLSGAFDANWFRHKAGQDFGCGIWYCVPRSRFQFTPGFTGKVGMGIKVGQQVYVDIGMKYSLSAAGNFFQSPEWWLTPFVGVLYRGVGD